MLIVHDGTAGYKDITVDLAAAALPQKVSWIDIVDGAPDEIAYVERASGRHIPSLAELKEIENSSRLRFEDGTFYLSMTMVSHATVSMPQSAPVGFVFTKDLLVTVRYAQLTSFASFAGSYAHQSGGAGGAGVFVGLIDAIIDRAADVLEDVGAELDHISQSVLNGEEPSDPGRHAPAKETANLRNVLRRIGRSGDLTSKIRDSLLGIARIVSYVGGVGADWFTPELRAHLEAQRRDVMSLSDYDAHLASKVQLLLDATMGLINIEQNNIIKVLTIVSVVGVPPTLVASMYGMNFRHMPELDWAWGYPYGLALIAISAIAPLVWFKFRGWL